MENYKLIDNKEDSRYEYQIEDLRPQVEYRMKNGEIYLTHTRVPEELRGKGIGKMLVKDVLDDIESKKIKVVPLCGFAATFIRRYPEYKKLLKEGIYIG